MKNSYAFYTDQLKGEYADIFSKIEAFVHTRMVDEETEEDQLGELLDLFLSAQEKNTPVTDIVGDDLREFCSRLCEGYTMKDTAVGFLERLYRLSIGGIVICILEIILAVWDYGTEGFFHTAAQVNLSGYFVSFLAAFLVMAIFSWIIEKVLFRLKKGSRKIINLLFVLSFVVSVGLSFYLLGSPLMNRLPQIKCIDVLGVFLIYCVGYRVFRRDKIRRDRQMKITWKELLGTETASGALNLEKDMSEEMEKRFQKKNKRLRSKGKEAMSLEAFLAEEEKECEKAEKLKWFYYVAPIVITILCSIAVPFEELIDAVLFAGILLAVEYGIMIAFWKLSLFGIREKRKWIAKKRMEDKEE